MNLTDEEKIQKAEEIYYRRNGINYKEKKKEKNHAFRNFFILFLIFFAAIGYQNRDFLMSQEFQKQLKEFLNTKIDVNKMFSTDNETIENKVIEPVEKEQMVDNTVSEVIMPFNGTITSKFGARSSNDARVTANHTGIDIAGNVGDKIVSAINGKVVLVSEEGDLGKHVKIENEKMATVYAHCNKIYVKEGEEIKQNQEIAEIGSTGNSTGPHLHFEVIVDNKNVDPLTVLEKNK